MRNDLDQRAGLGLRTIAFGACMAGLLLGCAGFDRELLEDLFDKPGHGHAGGGHGHGGGSGSGSDCGFVSSDTVLLAVANDLDTLDADDQPFTRYLSLAALSNAGSCGRDLDVARAALEKLVNSLSSDSVVTRLVPIDAAETLYRLDVRDYSWDRATEVDGTAFADGWEAIIAASPYAVSFVGAQADAAKALTGTAVPVLSGSAFVAAAASNAALYYGLLDIPANVEAFVLNDLAIDVAANLNDTQVVRAGLGDTSVSRLEFLTERHEIEVRAGALWQIFSDEAGAEALTADPLSTPPSAERELVFTLPNGLLAHALADADGQRLDASALTLDASETDFVARIARSYMNFRSQGVNATDEIREIVANDPDRFEPEELERIFAIYPASNDLQRVLDADRDSLGAALQNAGVDIDAPDPIHESFLAFDADVDADTAAAELYVSTEELISNLALLDPALSVLDGGRVDRNDFDALYLESLCILAVVNNNTVDPSLCD